MKSEVAPKKKKIVTKTIREKCEITTHILRDKKRWLVCNNNTPSQMHLKKNTEKVIKKKTII
jgi:hypothetical protein